MYITNLYADNLKLVRELALDFTHESKPRMWTVFVAENGACKTTLLQAIGLAASGPERANQLADVPSLPDLRRPTHAVRINAGFELGQHRKRWEFLVDTQFFKVLDADRQLYGLRSNLEIAPSQSTFAGESWFAPPKMLSSGIEASLQKNVKAVSAIRAKLQAHLEKAQVNEEIELTLTSQEFGLLSLVVNSAAKKPGPLSEARAKSFPGWFVAGYGTQRQLPIPLSTSELKDRVLNRLEPLFGKAALVGTGFANHFVDTPLFEPYIEALRCVFVEQGLLPNVHAVELRGKGGVVHSGDLARAHTFDFAIAGRKTSVPATWLSQGYQSTVSWVADLIGQMYMDFGEAIPLADMEGIVLVDELDLHLHPSWQVRLVPVLKRVFPRMQFIVTTHSPMILPAFERHEIVLLGLNEHGNVVAETPHSSPKLMTGSEIYASFFNIRKLYPNDLGDELRRYTYLSSDPTRTEDEDAEMLRLQKKLFDAGLDLGLPPVPREQQ